MEVYKYWIYLQIYNIVDAWKFLLLANNWKKIAKKLGFEAGMRGSTVPGLFLLLY